MPNEYWSAALTVIGVVAGAIATMVVGLFTAKSKGLTDITLAEIKDRASFYHMLIERANKAEARAEIALAAERKLIEENFQLRHEMNELQDRVEKLTDRLARFEQRQADAER